MSKLPSWRFLLHPPNLNIDYAFMILNQSLTPQTAKYYKNIWRNASYRVCVDGGTNEFHKYIHGTEDTLEGTSKWQQDASLPLPDFVSGDFDSIKSEVKEFYRNSGVKIVDTPDQNATDFTKALQHLDDLMKEKSAKVQEIFVSVGVSGNRFDHVMANINTLHTCSNLSTRVTLISDGSVMTLLEKGTHVIQPLEYEEEEDNWCAYVPFLGETKVTTKGLKYDIENGKAMFGVLVSTSNKFIPGQTVTIETDKALLWIMSFPSSMR